MYADRVEAEGNASVKERLSRNSAVSTTKRQETGKRLRDDDKWKHDLFEGPSPRVSSRIGGQDLRMKLQKKSSQQTNQSAKQSTRVLDLREKLLGTMKPQPVNTDPQPLTRVETSKPARKGASLEALTPLIKKGSNTTSKKKVSHKEESLEGFLQSLGLEKYHITFQAEEVDMAALVHMGDDDLKALGIPMGPRKKILMALGSKR